MDIRSRDVSVLSGPVRRAAARGGEGGNSASRLARLLRSFAGCADVPAGRVEQLEARQLLTLGFVPGPTQANFTQQPVILADFDGDGDADLATTSAPARGTIGTNILTIYRSNNDGTFTQTQQFNAGTVIAGVTRSGLLLADINNDGRQDILSNGINVFLSNGNGTFQPGQTLGGAGLIADDMIVYNFDNNALPDLVSLETTGRLVVYVNQLGTPGGFSAGPQIQLPGSDFILLGMGRVSDNTRPDILVYDANNQRLLAYSVSATAITEASRISGVEQRPAFADFNNDGRVDFAWTEGTGTSGQLKVALTTAQGQLGNENTVRQQSTAGFGYINVAQARDIDGDARPDLVVLRQNAGGRSWAVVRGDAAGAFDGLEVSAVAFPVSEAGGTVLSGSITSDGRTDLLRVINNTLSVFPGVGGPTIGSFTGPTEPVVPGQNYTLTVGNLARSGSRDIAALRFFLDTNQNGRLDLSDRLLSNITNQPGGGATISRTLLLEDGGPVGQVKVFAVALDANAISAVSETTLTLWTRLYYPEGFRTVGWVNEFIPMVNDNNFDVNYRVVLRYVEGERDQVIDQGVVKAKTRGGSLTTIREFTREQSVVRPDVAYAIEVQTDAVIGVQLARYDTFGAADPFAGTGESFTNRTALRWAFPDVQTTILDFLVIYNPFPDTANVTFTYTDDLGQEVNINRVVGGFRREGSAPFVEADAGLLSRLRNYSAVITSDRPIVAAHSRYVPAQSRSFTTLGQALETTDTDIVLTNLDLRPGVQHRTTFFNPNPFVVSVTIAGTYDGSNTNTTRTISLSPKERRVVDLTSDRPASATNGAYRITSVSQVAVFSETIDTQRRDAVGTSASTISSRKWGFGDGWLIPGQLGNQSFAFISLFNPSTSTANIRLRFSFVEGVNQQPVEVTVTLAPGRMDVVPLHQTPALTNRQNLGPYATVVESDVDVVASLTHWDLTQPGGWTTLGVPLDSVRFL